MPDFTNMTHVRRPQFIATAAVLLAACALQAQPPSSDQPLVTIVSPRQDQDVHRQAVDVVLNISPNADRRSLTLSLNDENITNRLRGLRECRAGLPCVISARVTARAGLLPGSNLLQVNAEAWAGSGEAKPEILERDFFWKCPGDCSGLGGAAGDSATTLPPSVSFSTLAPGGQQSGSAWVSIVSNLVAGGGGDFPASTHATCSERYQVLQLDRAKLTETDYQCYADDASLTAALKSSSLNGSLVIVGTTNGNTAGPALDTSPIGGTNYSSGYAGTNYPQSYMAIGVGGAAANTIYESYSTTAANNGDFTAQLNGTLAVGADGTYTFHPSENYTYSVDAKNLKITVNGNIYTAPSGANPGFWMLKLNRNTLANEHDCTVSSDNVTYANCGALFPTQTDAGIGNLANTLATATAQDLIFLVSSGASAGLLNTANARNLAAQFDGLGANGYSLESLINNFDATYVLITSTDPNFRKNTIGGDAVVSSNLFTNQNQTGSVTGILGRSLHGMFQPAYTLQASTANSTADFDYSFFESAWKQPQPWQSLDASEDAYRYVSYQAIKTANNGVAAGDDIHALFPASTNSLILNASPNSVEYPCSAATTTCTWSNEDTGESVIYTFTFTKDQMNAAAKDMTDELQDLAVVVKQMPVYKNVFTSSANGDPLLVDLMKSAATMASSLNQGGASVNLNYANIANLTGALFSVGNVATEGAGYGFLSALFWAAGSAGVTSVSSHSLPSPYLTIVDTVSNLAANAANYTSQVTTGFDVLADNIYSDPDKLHQAAVNMGIGGKWQLPNQVAPDGFPKMFEQAANTYFFTQIFGSVYHLDGFMQISSTVHSVAQIGGTGTNPGTGRPFCFPLYPTVATNSFVVNPSIGPFNPPVVDMLIMAGPINHQNTQRMTVDVPSQAVVNQLFNSVASGGLNLNFDQFWAPYGPASPRYSPNTPSLGVPPGFCVAN